MQPVRWKHKATIQNVIGRLPAVLGNPIYYQLQCRFGGLRRPNPLSRLRAGVEIVRRIQEFNRWIEEPVFLEVGTGHQMALPLSLWLCGASEVTTVDLNCYLKEKLVLGDIEYIRGHEEEVRQVFAVLPSDLFEKRLERLLADVSSLRDLFSLTNIRYWAPADATCLPLEANRIDYHVSYTVFEHIPPAVLKEILQEGCRLLKPGGLFVHHIDFTDHFAHSDSDISSINFLQFSEREWENLAGNRYMFHNRLRLDEFQNLLTDLKLSILALDSRVDNQAANLLDTGFPLDERFRSKSSITNAVTDAWVVASADAAL
jgi:SAM-dependent methyltransferase